MKVAIIGCGQLAMMLAQSGIKMGLSFSFLADEQEDSRSIFGLGKIVRHSKNMTPEEIYTALDKPDVVTVEREQVDVALLYALLEFTSVHPSPEAIAATQDRILEKRLLDSFNIPVANYAVVNNKEELMQFAIQVQSPVFLKHPRLGYDGKYQNSFKNLQELSDTNIAPNSFPYIIEEKVEFIFELSLICVRSTDGETRFYPGTINYHQDGILLRSYTSQNPAIDEQLLSVRLYMDALLNYWDYVGVFTLELFATENGLIVNECAPRVHNSGHWTMDSNICSQFENHIRAITGEALGRTQPHEAAGMINLLGITPPTEALPKNCHLYDYKKTLKPRRKMGHINFTHENLNMILTAQDELINKLYGAPTDSRKTA